MQTFACWAPARSSYEVAKYAKAGRKSQPKLDHMLCFPIEAPRRYLQTRWKRTLADAFVRTICTKSGPCENHASAGRAFGQAGWTGSSLAALCALFEAAFRPEVWITCLALFGPLSWQGHNLEKISKSNGFAMIYAITQILTTATLWEFSKSYT